MSLSDFESYLEKLKTSWRETRMDSLRQQKKFLLALHGHHLIWAKDVDNAELADMHTEIATLIQEILQKYDRVLNM